MEGGGYHESGSNYQRGRETGSKVPNYYDILGVTSGVTKRDLKRAYREMARKTHPDMNGGSKESEERFKLVNEANEVLSDPQKRAAYDQQLRYKESGRKSDSRTGNGASSTGPAESQYAHYEKYYAAYGGSGGESNQKSKTKDRGSKNNSNAGKRKTDGSTSQTGSGYTGYSEYNKRSDSERSNSGSKDRRSTNNNRTNNEPPKYQGMSEEELKRDIELKRKKFQQAEQRSRKMSVGLADVCWDEISDGKKRAENIELLLDVGRYISSDITDPRITVKLTDKIRLFTAAENVLYTKGLSTEGVQERIGRLRAFMVGLDVKREGDGENAIFDSEEAFFEFERRRDIESRKREKDDVLPNTGLKLEEFKERWKANVSTFNQLDLKDDELWIMPKYLKDKKIEALKQDTEKKAKELAAMYGSLLYENKGAKLQEFMDAGLGKVDFFDARARRRSILDKFDLLADKGIDRFEGKEIDRMFIVFKRENPGIEPGKVMAEFNRYLVTVARALKYDGDYSIGLLADEEELVPSRYDNEVFDFRTKFNEELTIKRKDAKEHIKRGDRWYLRSINQ